MQNNLYIAKFSVSTILNASINNQDLDEAVLSGLVEAAITTVLAATTISKSKEELDKIKNNIMHASLGALKGTLVGALDGLISAVLPEYFPDKLLKEVQLDEASKIEQEQLSTSKKPNLSQSNRSKQKIDLLSKGPSDKLFAKTMNNYGLIDSEVSQKYQTNFAEKLLDFFIPAANASEEFSGTSTSSSDSNPSKQLPERTFTVLWSAIKADPKAQLEMRNRCPEAASFFDKVSDEHGRWNTPMLQFKKYIHSKLGFSWFVPGSMDDLGQACLNAGLAATGVGPITKGVDLYRKTQFAYQAYKKVNCINEILKEASTGGKYSGEFKRYMQEQSIKELRKTISSHQKRIAKHKEYIENPKIKYQNWDNKSQLEKNNAIHHWQEDIKRAKIYEELAKIALNKKTNGVIVEISCEAPKIPKP